MLVAETLTLVHAAVLGVIEGLTEFLPVSSTGHLLVAQRVLGLDATGEAGRALDAYAICIQAGAMLAVTALYPRRIRSVLHGVVRPGDGRRLLLALAVAFVPAAIVGVVLGDVIQQRLFDVGPVALAWIAGGVALLIFQRTKSAGGGARPLEQLTARHAALIGIVQIAAMWPGISRSLTTIVAALALGYTMRAAIEFSFLLGLLTLSAATGFAAMNDGHLILSTFGLVVPLLGVLVAFLSALVAMRWMVERVNDRGLRVFGWYRVFLGVATLAVIASS